MRKTWKKYAAVAMAGVLSAGMLAGCGDKKEEVLDGSKAVATVNGEEIPLGVVSYMLRNQQAYVTNMYAMYASYGLNIDLNNIWDSPASEDSEQTYGEQTRDQVMEQVELLYILRSKAADYGVEVTADEKEKIAAAVASFMEANSAETIAALGVTEETMKTYMELETYFSKLREPIMEGADMNVPDEEVQMSSFSFVHVTVPTEEEDAAEELETVAEEAAEEVEAEAEEVVEEAEAEVEEVAEEAEAEVEEAAEETEAEAETPAEPTEAQLKAKANAEALYEAMVKDPEADLQEIADGIGEGLYASTGKFMTTLSDDYEDRTPSYLNEDMIAALRELKEGEITPVIETEDSGYYVARLDKVFDEDATEQERQEVINARKDAFYEETTQAWLDEAAVTVNADVLAALKVTDSMRFTVTSNYGKDEVEEEIADEDVVEAEIVDEEAETAEEVVEEAEEEIPEVGEPAEEAEETEEK